MNNKIIAMPSVSEGKAAKNDVKPKNTVYTQPSTYTAKPDATGRLTWDANIFHPEDATQSGDPSRIIVDKYGTRRAMGLLFKWGRTLLGNLKDIGMNPKVTDEELAQGVNAQQFINRWVTTQQERTQVVGMNPKVTDEELAQGVNEVQKAYENSFGDNDERLDLSLLLSSTKPEDGMRVKVDGIWKATDKAALYLLSGGDEAFAKEMNPRPERIEHAKNYIQSKWKVED